MSRQDRMSARRNSGDRMANPDHVKVVRKGPVRVSSWQGKSPIVRLDLAEADLTGLNLPAANLANANLARSNLRGANLAAARLDWANLVEANLEGADLLEASLYRANLEIVFCLLPPT